MIWNYFAGIASELGARLLIAATLVSAFLVSDCQAQTCAPIPSGLVSWWPGEGNALDVAGGNNGTIGTNVTFSAGEVGQAFVFGTGSGAVRVNNTLALQVQNFTIEAWIRRGSLTFPTSDELIFGGGDSSYGLGLTSSGVPFLTKIDIDNVKPTGIAISDTNFHHLAVTKNGTNAAFYVDGVAYPTPPYNTSYSFGYAFAIGARGDNLSAPFFGSIDEVSVYNRALLPSEIQSIYLASNLGKCTGPSPAMVDGTSGDQSVAPGTNVTFSVFASGSAPLRYAWQFNGTTLSGATNSSLTVNNVQSINAGNYIAIVTNAYGSATSSPMTLTVMGPPAIVESPAGQNVAHGGSAAFFVDVAGSGPLFYQWFLNATNPVGLNDYSLLITNAQATNAGSYSVVVNNSFGSVTSAPAVLIVLLPPVITNQPQSQTNYLGGAAYFSVSAITFGSANLSYQWQFKGANINAATNSTLAVLNLSANSAGNYSVIVTNLYGKTASSNALLTVVPPVCTPAPSGLVGWWQGEGSPNDVLGMNNGTIVGTVTYAPGEVGRAFVFNGSSSAITLSNTPALQLQNFTIEAWIQRGSLSPASDGLIFAYGDSGYGLGMTPGGTPFLTRVDVSNAKPSYAITDTNFHHLTVTKNSTNVIFYVDGVAYPAPPYSDTFGFNTAPAIGNRSDNLASHYLGKIDEVSVYNRALSATEVQSIYAATMLGKCSVPVSVVGQPSTQSVTFGSNTTLNVTVAGTGPISYQWFLNGALVVGATNSTLQLTKANFFQAGSYSVSVSNVDGTLVISNMVVSVQPPPLLVDGSFETGDFTGWITTNIPLPLYPLAVEPAGFNPQFGFFLSAPTDGSFCATGPFEGDGPGTASIAQDVVLPAGPASLTFDYRLAWDMMDYSGSTLPRTFNVTVQPYGGGTPLHTFTIFTAQPGTADPDTGSLSSSLDLSAYSGRGLRISFDANVPEAFTGPGFFQLDHVALAYSVLPPLAITQSGTNVILSWPASTTNFTLQSVSRLNFPPIVWSPVNPNLFVHGPTNTSVALPMSSAAKYYRLKYP